MDSRGVVLKMTADGVTTAGQQALAGRFSVSVTRRQGHNRRKWRITAKAPTRGSFYFCKKLIPAPKLSRIVAVFRCMRGASRGRLDRWQRDTGRGCSIRVETIPRLAAPTWVRSPGPRELKAAGMPQILSERRRRCLSLPHGPPVRLPHRSAPHFSSIRANWLRMQTLDQARDPRHGRALRCGAARTELD